MSQYFKDPRGQVVEFKEAMEEDSLAHMKKFGWKKSTALAFKEQEKDRNRVLKTLQPASEDALGKPRIVGVMADKAGNLMSLDLLAGRASPLLGTILGG